MSTKKTHHIIPNPNGGWDIKKGGAERASGHFNNKQKAIKRARELCVNQKSTLIIHNQHGKIIRVQKAVVSKDAVTGISVSPKSAGGTHSTGTKKR